MPTLLLTRAPQKELLLQDIVDVEYVPLETTDEFITHGAVKAVGPSIIITGNRTNLGDLFLFDRHTGKGIRKIHFPIFCARLSQDFLQNLKI